MSFLPYPHDKYSEKLHVLDIQQTPDPTETKNLTNTSKLCISHSSAKRASLTGSPFLCLFTYTSQLKALHKPPLSSCCAELPKAE